MKNLELLVSKDDIIEYVGGLWKTDLFRESTFVRSVVDRFAYLPRIFAEETNDKLERAHFCTWWNVIMKRNDYANPYIHDLYYLHEFYHASKMPYIPNIGRAAFDEKMQRNELEASVMSEITIYFELPELRELSFDHTIYADRFTCDPLLQWLWANNRDVCIEMIRSMRRDVMVSKPEADMDITELWIRRFSEQNTAYSVVWADRYKDVENAMSLLIWNTNVNRHEAGHLHIDWLVREMDNDPVDGIPFRQEAELFSPFYWANKAKYAKAMKDNGSAM